MKGGEKMTKSVNIYEIQTVDGKTTRFSSELTLEWLLENERTSFITDMYEQINIMIDKITQFKHCGIVEVEAE